jgi:hypothetical protein
MIRTPFGIKSERIKILQITRWILFVVFSSGAFLILPARFDGPVNWNQLCVCIVLALLSIAWSPR